jgi:osmotically-inducible protein OsmY
MRRHVVQILLAVSLPLTFAVGCSNTRQQEAAVYSPAAGAALTPAGENSGTGNSDDALAPEGITRTTAPSGASAADWALGEELRAALTSDKSLAQHDQIGVTVDKDTKGLVRLHGVMQNNDDRQALTNRIARVPGVLQMDDQIAVGFGPKKGIVDLQNPEK